MSAGLTKPCDHNVLHATGIRLQFNGIDCPYCEAERLRAALIEIQRQTYGSRWEAAVTAHAIATQALDGAVTAKLAVERIAQELATRPADEPSEVPDCPRCGVAHYPPCPERPLGHTGGSDCPCSECVAWRTSKSNPPRELTLQDFGYAPGNYAIKCLDCGQESLGCAKRAARCETCAKQALAENRKGLSQRT